MNPIKNPPETPQEAFELTVSHGGLSCFNASSRTRLWKGRPGEVVEHMSPEVRALLRQLTSDMIGPDQFRKGRDGYISELSKFWLVSDYFASWGTGGVDVVCLGKPHSGETRPGRRYALPPADPKPIRPRGRWGL